MEGVIDVVAGPGGSLLMDGYPPLNLDPQHSALVKLTPDGSLDPSFGTGGLALVAPRFGSIAATDDGGLLAVGGATVDGKTAVSSARITPTGTIDPGDGTGGIATYAPPGRGEGAVDIVLTPAGATIVGTASGADARLVDADILLLGITATGPLDAGSGDGGRIQTNLGQPGNDMFRVVLPLPDGDIFVAGDDGALGDALVAGRYDADGTPDADHPPSEVLAGQLDARVPLAGAVAPDGSVFLVAQFEDRRPGEASFTAGGSPSWRLVKFAPDGGLDTGFGAGGVVVHTEQCYPNGVAVRPDGTILVHPGRRRRHVVRHRPLLLADPDGGATVVEYTVSTRGSFYHDLVIRRLRADGSPATGFSQDGMAQAAFANGGPPNGVSDAALLGPDILVSGGRPGAAGDIDAYVVRVNGHTPERSLPPG